MTLLDVGATITLGGLLAAGSIIDARSMRLPDWVTLSLLAIGIALNLGDVPRLVECVLAAGAGFAAFWIIGEVYARRTGLAGLGLGDAKLLAAAGAWLGPLALAPIVLGASILALTFVGVRRLAGRSIGSRTVVPFGPFLSIGFAVAWGATRFAGV